MSVTGSGKVPAKGKRPCEMAVFTRAKDLCTYVVDITQRTPKQFRFTFASRMQNLSLDILSDMYLANGIYVMSADADAQERLLERRRLQQGAITKVKLLCYISEIAMTQHAILPKHYEQIAKRSTDVLKMLGAWIKSDKERWTASCK